MVPAATLPHNCNFCELSDKKGGCAILDHEGTRLIDDPRNERFDAVVEWVNTTGPIWEGVMPPVELHEPPCPGFY